MCLPTIGNDSLFRINMGDAHNKFESLVGILLKLFAFCTGFAVVISGVGYLLLGFDVPLVMAVFFLFTLIFFLVGFAIIGCKVLFWLLKRFLVSKIFWLVFFVTLLVALIGILVGPMDPPLFDVGALLNF